MVYADTCFPSGRLKLSYLLGRVRPQSKPLALSLWWTSLRGNTEYALWHSLHKNWEHPWASGGRRLHEACTQFPSDFTYTSFPFDNFALYHLAIINHRYMIIHWALWVLLSYWSCGGLGDSQQEHLNSKFDELQESECGQGWEWETFADCFCGEMNSHIFRGFIFRYPTQFLFGVLSNIFPLL